MKTRCRGYSERLSAQPRQICQMCLRHRECVPPSLFLYFLFLLQSTYPPYLYQMSYRPSLMFGFCRGINGFQFRQIRGNDKLKGIHAA